MPAKGRQLSGIELASAGTITMFGPYAISRDRQSAKQRHGCRCRGRLDELSQVFQRHRHDTCVRTVSSSGRLTSFVAIRMCEQIGLDNTPPIVLPTVEPTDLTRVGRRRTYWTTWFILPFNGSARIYGSTEAENIESDDKCSMELLRQSSTRRCRLLAGCLQP